MASQYRQVARRVMVRHHVFHASKSDAGSCRVPVSRGDCHGALVLVYLDLLNSFKAFQVEFILRERGPFGSLHPGCAIITDNCSMLADIHLHIGALFGAKAILDLPDVRVPTV